MITEARRGRSARREGDDSVRGKERGTANIRKKKEMTKNEMKNEEEETGGQ